jgi:hypothetical protein
MLCVSAAGTSAEDVVGNLSAQTPASLKNSRAHEHAGVGIENESDQVE